MSSLPDTVGWSEEEEEETGWLLISISPRRTTLTAPSQRRELEWLLNELHETLQTLKSGLQDCYALLAPVDPGSTLVVSTPRNEIVKGHVTRVGTRIVKGVRLFSPLSFLSSNAKRLNSKYRPSPSVCEPTHTRPTPSRRPRPSTSRHSPISTPCSTTPSSCSPSP